MRTRRHLSVGVVGLSLALASPALAGTKSFEGSLKVNDGPVSFDAVKKNGRYRAIPVMSVSNIPVQCEDGATERSIDYGELDVSREQKVNEGDGFARIKGEFVAREVFEGTVKIKGEGQGIFCTSNGPLKFKAKLVP